MRDSLAQALPTPCAKLKGRVFAIQGLTVPGPKGVKK